VIKKVPTVKPLLTAFVAGKWIHTTDWSIGLFHFVPARSLRGNGRRVSAYKNALAR